MLNAEIISGKELAAELVDTGVLMAEAMPNATYTVQAVTASVERTANGVRISMSDGTGTTTAELLDGQRGEKGEKGDTGAAGQKGETGPQGEQGPKGERGPQGVQGEQGIQGAQGPRGYTGPAGPQGERGEKGLKGDTGETGPQGQRGPQGPQGEKGDKGETGPQGPQGERGPAGTITPEAQAEITQEVLDTLPSWSKAANKPTYTAAEVGALPDTTVIPEAVTDAHINALIDAKLGVIENGTY